MRKHLLDLIGLTVGATVVLVGLVVAEPGWRDRTLHIYLVVVGGLALAGLVTEATGGHRRSAFSAALGERPKSVGRLAELARVEREVTLATATARDLHLRLLPSLREIAWARLERTGREPGPETLGRWWELLRPDREPVTDRFAPGISERELGALIRDLEMI
jgi:hypothetical protein